MKRGGPLKRKTRLQSDPSKVREWQDRSRSELPAESPKRKAERPARKAVREQAIADARGQCAARDLVPEVTCWHPPGIPFDVDERASRGVYPGGHLDPDNVQLMCRAHHDWRGANPEEAKARGLRLSAWEVVNPRDKFTPLNPPTNEE